MDVNSEPSKISIKELTFHNFFEHRQKFVHFLCIFSGQRRSYTISAVDGQYHHFKKASSRSTCIPIRTIKRNRYTGILGYRARNQRTRASMPPLDVFNRKVFGYCRHKVIPVAGRYTHFFMKAIYFIYFLY